MLLFYPHLDHLIFKRIIVLYEFLRLLKNEGDQGGYSALPRWSLVGKELPRQPPLPVSPPPQACDPEMPQGPPGLPWPSRWQHY